MAGTPAQQPPASPPPRRIPVQDLLQGRSEVILVHEGQEYRLRLTQQKKLLLTK